MLLSGPQQTSRLHTWWGTFSAPLWQTEVSQGPSWQSSHDLGLCQTDWGATWLVFLGICKSLRSPFFPWASLTNFSLVICLCSLPCGYAFFLLLFREHYYIGVQLFYSICLLLFSGWNFLSINISFFRFFADSRHFFFLFPIYL